MPEKTDSKEEEIYGLFVQKSRLPLYFADYLSEWVVQKEKNQKPVFLTSGDMLYLADLSVRCLRQRALGEEEMPWHPLLPALEGWKIQRHKGEKPSVLTEKDCRDLLRLVLKALASPVYVPEALSGETEKQLTQDPLYFLREHLALGL